MHLDQTQHKPSKGCVLKGEWFWNRHVRGPLRWYLMTTTLPTIDVIQKEEIRVEPRKILTGAKKRELARFWGTKVLRLLSLKSGSQMFPITVGQLHAEMGSSCNFLLKAVLNACGLRMGS